MRPLSYRVRKEVNTNRFYKTCVITGWTDEDCKKSGLKVYISIEHALEYAGKQMDEPWAVVGLRSDLNTSYMPLDIKEKCRIVCLIRSTPEDLRKYPKKDWNQIKKYLFNKYPEFYQLSLKKYGGNQISMDIPGYQDKSLLSSPCVPKKKT